jgi:dual specificity tyrosine-phosphorylation-regulated kinase 2/3/4
MKLDFMNLYVGAVVLKQCASNMTEFEQQEILPYVDIFFLGLDCQKIRPSSTPGNCNFG